MSSFLDQSHRHNHTNWVQISLKSTGKIKKKDTATHSGTEVHRHKRMGGQKEVIQANYGGKILQHVTIPRD